MTSEGDEARRDFYKAQAAKARQDIENARTLEEARSGSEAPSGVWEQWIQQQMRKVDNND